jgi:ubiquinone biosynthesis protein
VPVILHEHTDREDGTMSALLPKPWFADRPVVDRTHHIARVLTAHGLGALVHEAGLRRFAPPGLRPSGDAQFSQPERLRIAIGELGATFTKLGQMLSTRGDILPPEYLTQLAKLQDAAPVVPIEAVLSIVRSELGAPATERYAHFELTPLASASIGQVHAATLHDGTEVVVKVQRPGVADEIERDLQIMRRLVDWVQNHTAFGADYDVRSLVDEFAHTIHGELDYVREGQNADRLRRCFDGDPSVLIPRVFWDYTSRRVLTLERVGGIKITDLAVLDERGISRRGIAQSAVRMFLRQVMEFGFFHADPHPGNFFVQPDGAIAVVDFGMVGRVSESVQLHLLRAGLAAMSEDAEALAEELYALGVAGRHADRHAFEKDLDHLIGHYGGQSVADLSATAVTSELSGIVFRHRLQLPSELALLIRVLSMSEGMGLMLDPTFRYLEYASPILREHWKRRISLGARARQFGRSAAEAADLAAQLPRRTQRMLGRLERGEFELNVRHERLEEVTREFQNMTNRLSLAMILSASVIALGVALGAHGGAEIQRYVRWLFLLGFVFSLGFGIWVLLSILRSGRR